MRPPDVSPDPEDQSDSLLDSLWDACPDRLKRRAFTNPDNGLGILAERRENHVLFRVTTKLWRQQPFGVLFGSEISRRVYKEGSVVIANVYPRSANVASGKLPQKHIAIEVMPTEVWLAEREFSPQTLQNSLDV